MGWRWIAGPIAVFLLLALLAGCKDANEKSALDGVRPAPLLYEIASADGTVEGWMLGTIHALPADMAWRTPLIAGTIDRADLLVVEVASLGNRRRTAQAFAALAETPGQPPLAERVPANLEPSLAALLHRGGHTSETFSSTETWAAALTLARVDAAGDPAHGVDRALVMDFTGRPIRELEGAAGQLAIFDRLPEAQQRAMLAAVVQESEAARADPARLQKAWLAGDAAAIEASSREGMLADPLLREALLVGRNRRWAAVLGPLLKEQPRPLIAVGAAHLVGSDGLAAMLEAQGYKVRRLAAR